MLSKFVGTWKLSSNEIHMFQKKVNIHVKFLLLHIMHLCIQSLAADSRQLSSSQVFTVSSAVKETETEGWRQNVFMPMKIFSPMRKKCNINFKDFVLLYFVRFQPHLFHFLERNISFSVTKSFI